MAKLITIDCEDVLAEGADPRQLWRAVKQIFDALNDLTVTVSPTDAGSARINDGDIQLNLKVITQAAAPNVIPGYAPPGSSVVKGGAFDGAIASGSADGSVD